MSPIFRNLGKIPEETAHVLQNLVSAKGLNRSITLTYKLQLHYNSKPSAITTFVHNQLRNWNYWYNYSDV